MSNSYPVREVNFDNLSEQLGGSLLAGFFSGRSQKVLAGESSMFAPSLEP